VSETNFGSTKVTGLLEVTPSPTIYTPTINTTVSSTSGPNTTVDTNTTNAPR